MSQPPKVVVLSDDLTGTTGAGAEARRRTSAVEVVRWDCLDTARQCHVLIVDTHSRLLDDAVAAQRVGAVTRALVARYGSAPQYYKRVDSQLRGAVAAEVRAWAQVLGLPLVLATAAPGLGITSVGGRQYIRGRPVKRSPCPGDTARLIGAIEIPAQPPVLIDPIAQADALAAVIRRCEPIAADATDIAALAAVAQAVVAARREGRQVALVGSYGLLGAYLDGRGEHPEGAGVLVASDSLQPTSLTQLAGFAAENGTLLMLDEEPADVLISHAVKAIQDGRDVAISSIAPGRETVVADPAVSNRLATVVTGILDEVSPAGLVAMGGELASRLLEHLDATGLRVLSEPWPATPIVRIVGGSHPELIAVFQSGSQGEPDRILRIVNTIRWSSLSNDNSDFTQERNTP